MREQSRIFKCTLFIVMSSLVLTILLEWNIDRLFYKGLYPVLTGHRAFAINIGIGIFTGAILSSGIAYIGYQYQKKKYIDDCCDYLNLFDQKISNLKYLYLVIDIKLLGQLDNAIESQFNLKLADRIKAEILQWYKINHPDISPEILWSQDNQNEKEIPRVIASYNEFLQFDISNADCLLNERDSFFKKSAQNKDLETALNNIKKLYEKITEKLQYMKDFSSKANQLDTIEQLQKEIFAPVEYLGSAVLLPPKNIAVESIQQAIKQIKSNKRGKINEQSTTDKKVD